MTEVNIEAFGKTYELGVDPVPDTVLLWSPSSYLRKGVSSAPIIAGSAMAAAMAGAAQTTSTTSPVHSSVLAGFSTAFNRTPNFYIVPTPNHPRFPVFVYKGGKSNGAGGLWPDAWTSGQTYSGAVTPWPAAQQHYCASVPVPLGGDGVTPFDAYYGKTIEDATSDHHVTIYDPWHDEIWDFEQFNSLNTGFQTHSSVSGTHWTPPSGYTIPTSQAGYFYGCDQPGYIGSILGTSVQHGDGIAYGGPNKTVLLPDGSFAQVAGTAISLMAGTITIEDVMRQEIDHMLQIAINCGSGHIAPAISDDLTPHRSQLSSTAAGTNNDFTYSSTEGAIFRIDPAWTPPPLGDLISAHPDLAQTGLGTNTSQVVAPWHLMVWKAMQQYGFIVSDFGSCSMQWVGTGSLDTPYCKYTSAQVTAMQTALGTTGSPGNPFGCAPWNSIQQVAYPF